MQIMVSIGTVAAFFDCPVLLTFFLSLDRFSRFMAQTTCFRKKMVRWVAMFGKMYPEKLHKNGREWAILSQNSKI